MKYSIVVLICFVACTAMAQDGETRFALKAGITSSDLHGTDISKLSPGGSVSSLSGFHVGAMLNSKLRSHFWLKTELLFIQKGGSIQRLDASSQSYKSDFKSQYIDLYPASATFHWKGFQVLAGPYVSMLLTGTIQEKDASGNLVTVSNYGSPTVNSNYRQKFDAGIVLGAEYEFKWGILLGVRYTNGFVPVIENAAAVSPVNTPEQPQLKVFNSSLSVSLGYSFGSKSK